jgi:hypothetical protein
MSVRGSFGTKIGQCICVRNGVMAARCALGGAMALSLYLLSLIDPDR